MSSWNVLDSLKLYDVHNWGGGYFHINESGDMTVDPKKGENFNISLKDIVQEVKSQGLGTPLLIRFQDIIRHRVVTLNEAFQKAIHEYGYQGTYQGVYPIKANQMREVVEEILDAGKPYRFGLEAGSKAELVAVLGMNNTPESLIICNGYKDSHFIRLALFGLKIGKRVFLIVEKLSELSLILQIAKEVGVVPQIGIRAKLFARGIGQWESSSGENAKFGLSTPEIIQAVHLLKKENCESSFKLLHFHIGSQVTDIKNIKDAVKEGARIYAKLKKLGLPLEFLDVGGGLGVDYDGSQTSCKSSMNYSLTEYVNDVVYSIQEVCQAEDIPEPHIVSESGRALVAYHSVLVVNVFGNIEIDFQSDILTEGTTQEHSIIKEMRYLFQHLSEKNLFEYFHDALACKEEALSLFRLGFLSLEDRAKVESLFAWIAKKVSSYSEDLRSIPEEVATLKDFLSNQYLCNFSLFQSIPDHWAIQHLFPIVPLQRLQEEPTQDVTLADITCDSDGKVSHFIGLGEEKKTLRLHSLNSMEPYYLGLFLMGAYQDIMGDLHNLFGRVHEVHVFLDESEPGGYYIEEVISGNTISDVLSLIQYNAKDLEKKMKESIDIRVKEGVLKPKEGVEFQKYYEDILHGYTYLGTEEERKRFFHSSY